jgi:hypothetical protein
MTRYQLASMCRYLTRREIALAIGVNMDTVGFLLRQHGLTAVPSRAKERPLPLAALGISAQHRETIAAYAMFFGADRASRFFAVDRHVVNECLRKD